MDLKIFAAMSEKMNEGELLEMTRVYQRRMDAMYPPAPQLKARGPVACEDEDRAFLI